MTAIRVETRRWTRLLRLFRKNGKGIEKLTHRLECALSQINPCDSEPLIRTWNDMVALAYSVVEATDATKEKP